MLLQFLRPPNTETFHAASTTQVSAQGLLRKFQAGMFHLGIALALLTGLTGCGKHTSADRGAAKVTKLAFVTNNASEFWKIAAAGVHEYEKEGKTQVDIKMPTTGTTAEQNQILETLVSQRYDVIAVSPIAPTDQVPLLDRVAAATRLITFDSDAPQSQRLLYIGTDNYLAGQTLGAQIVKLLPEGGTIAVFVGTLAADNAKQRLNGIEDAISGHRITIVAEREDNADRAKARSNVEDMINAHGDLGVVVGLWTYNGPAIAAAIKALGKTGKIQAAVFDEEEETLDAIAEGIIAVTVVQKPYQFGYLSSKWMRDLAFNGQEAIARIPGSKVIDTGIEVVDKSNVDAFRKALTELQKSH